MYVCGYVHMSTGVLTGHSVRFHRTEVTGVCEPPGVPGTELRNSRRAELTELFLQPDVLRFQN